jgi:hypothetical protein
MVTFVVFVMLPSLVQSNGNKIVSALEVREINETSKYVDCTLVNVGCEVRPRAEV